MERQGQGSGERGAREGGWEGKGTEQGSEIEKQKIGGWLGGKKPEGRHVGPAPGLRGLAWAWGVWALALLPALVRVAGSGHKS